MTALDLDDVDPQRRAAVALDAVTSAQRKWDQEHRRPAALTPREALAALRYEALFVGVVAANVREGVQLTEIDYARLSTACRWIEIICGEVHR
jgi:hypothetical protein